MMRLALISCAAVVVLTLSACPSGSSKSANTQTYSIEGSWRSSAGTTITIAGATARLRAFPSGSVIGRDIFDVGDLYLRAITSAGAKRYDCEEARFDTDDSQQGLAITAVHYEHCTLEALEASLLALEHADGSRDSFERVTGDVHDVHGGACEGHFLDVPEYFICNDTHTQGECSYGALIDGLTFSAAGNFEFTEGASCSDLGYGFKYDEPGRYQYSATDRTTPGPRGKLVGAGASSDAGPSQSADAGVMSADGGVSGPATDGGVSGQATDGGAGAGSYVIFGRVWDHATYDCTEGSNVYDDCRAYYWKQITGKYSNTYTASHDALQAQMMTTDPGALRYDVESSYFVYGPQASHAVVIKYAQVLTAWNCHPQIIAIGYGTTYDEALNQVLKIKSDDGSASASYQELEHVTW